MPKVGDSAIRSGAKAVRKWVRTMGKRASEEAAKEEVRVAVKDAAAEVAKELAKDSISEAVKSRAEKKSKAAAEEKSKSKAAEVEVDGIRVSIIEEEAAAGGGEERPRAASPPEADRVAQEFQALKEFVASVLAETTAKATTANPVEEGGGILPRLAIVGLVGGVLIGAYLVYLRRRGAAAPEPEERCVGYRGRPAPIGLPDLLRGGGPALHRIDFAASRRIIPPSSDKCMHKNHLQSFAEREYRKLPLYKVETEGKSHQLKFRCTVEVGGKQFSSAGSFDHKKEAEQDAARVAYQNLSIIGDEEIKESFGLIDQDVIFCKSILHEFAVKTNKTLPLYTVVCLVKPMTMFAASVLFAENRYTGESAPTKKDAEQNAARAVIKSFLAKHNTCMVAIIRSKKHRITAIRSSGSTLATFTPIEFTCPVSYAAHGGPDHVARLLQSASS